MSKTKDLRLLFRSQPPIFGDYFHRQCNYWRHTGPRFGSGSGGIATCAQGSWNWIQVNLIKNPIFRKIWIFPPNKSVHFSPFEEKMCYERTRSLRVFPNCLFKQLQWKSHPKKNCREFWIDCNISTVTYQKNRFLKIIYLYSDPNSVSVRSDYVSDAKFNPRGMHHVYAITHTFLDLIQRTKLLPDSLNATAVLHTPQNQVFFPYIYMLTGLGYS